MNEFSPCIYSQLYTVTYKCLLILLLELEAAVREKDVATSECECLKRRAEVLMTDCEQEKKEKFETKVYTSTVTPTADTVRVVNEWP